MEIGRGVYHFVIHGRSKERSDAAQTRGSMPGLPSATTVQNNAPLHSTAKVTEWILGSSRRRFAAAPPVDDEVEGLRLLPNVYGGPRLQDRDLITPLVG